MKQSNSRQTSSAIHHKSLTDSKRRMRFRFRVYNYNPRLCYVAVLTWITVRQQGTDGEQDLRDGQSRAPVILQDVQTNHTLTIDVAVIDPRTERDLHGRENPRDWQNSMMLAHRRRTSL